MAIPATVDVKAYQGDTLPVYCRIREQKWNEQFQKYVEGDYVDLTGKVGRGDVRESIESAQVAATFAVTLDAQGSPDTIGGFTAKLTAAQTALMTKPSYVYDIQFTDGDTVQTLIRGTITMIPEVTRGV